MQEAWDLNVKMFSKDFNMYFLQVILMKRS